MYFNSSRDLVPGARADLPPVLYFTWCMDNVVPVPKSFRLFENTQFADMYYSKFWASRGIEEFILAEDRNGNPMLAKISNLDPNNITPFLKHSPKMEQLFNVLISVSQDRAAHGHGDPHAITQGQPYGMIDGNRKEYRCQLVSLTGVGNDFYAIIEPLWAVKGFDEATPGLVYQIHFDDFGVYALSLCSDVNIVWKVLDDYVDGTEASGYSVDDDSLF